MSAISAVRKLTKLVKLLRRPEYRRALRFGVAAAIEHEPVLRSLILGSIVDVGANRGQFSLAAAAFHPDAVLHAFEPLPGARAGYADVFRGRAVPPVLHPFAAGADNASAPLHLSRRNDSSSLLPIGEGQVRMFPGTEAVGELMVQVRRGDEVLALVDLPAPLLIKLDVQGGELAALQGMPDTLSRAAFVYAEISFRSLYDGQPLADEVIAWLSERGFGLKGFFNPAWDSGGLPVQADALFSRCEPRAGD